MCSRPQPLTRSSVLPSIISRANTRSFAGVVFCEKADSDTVSVRGRSAEVGPGEPEASPGPARRLSRRRGGVLLGGLQTPPAKGHLQAIRLASTATIGPRSLTRGA
jgi:hypothetical protein